MPGPRQSRKLCKNRAESIRNCEHDLLIHALSYCPEDFYNLLLETHLIGRRSLKKIRFREDMKQGRGK